MPVVIRLGMSASLTLIGDGSSAGKTLNHHRVKQLITIIRARYKAGV